jgi:hypothetical protein
MSSERPIPENEPCILIECPCWGDAEFFGIQSDSLTIAQHQVSTPKCSAAERRDR